MKKKKTLNYKRTILIVFFAVVVVVLSSFAFDLNSKSIVVKLPETSSAEPSSTKDFRDQGYINETIISLIWIDKPLEGVQCQLIDENFIVLKTTHSDSNGVCDFKYESRTGDYYIRISYNASFSKGGVEQFKAWFLIKLGCSQFACNLLRINDVLTPATWSDEPSVLIK
jgi:hypothetical protein